MLGTSPLARSCPLFATSCLIRRGQCGLWAFSEEIEALASEPLTRSYITNAWTSRELPKSEESDSFARPSIARWRIERGSRGSIANVVGVDRSVAADDSKTIHFHHQRFHRHVPIPLRCSEFSRVSDGVILSSSHIAGNPMIQRQISSLTVYLSALRQI